ncbi:esterase-like activity of phytase family protein [Asticcacaulis sp. EMRT-3]|uniref:esterase-like activity of phytase family protein n=1 Tax=Asticcacaulis sp. EMRT-3 TaxID=3040349 RepID=UPI0024AF2BE9|nr:esterase-like activity of phytase family protein [Asticcacaulis sp. EMRT-3]MDI7776142.1 esterase-like activity of phytase family protein [Asticcacaulis sp. EMRT-3]
MSLRSHLLCAVAALSFMAAGSTQAEPALIATLRIPADAADKADMPEALLENGVSNHLLGGLGSGLAYAGGDHFVALPDRGPNANVYNPIVDNTVSYVARFHTLSLRLTANPAAGQAAQLPYRVDASLDKTTLLFAPTPLVYGDGVAAHIRDGRPDINTGSKYYFTGRSDGFSADESSLAADQARLDPEGVRVSPDGASLYISDEYGPHLYQFDARTGERLKSFAIPAKFGVAVQGASEDVELAANRSGRASNKGMEGLAITPDGKFLLGAMQAPLLQDGGASGTCIRLIRFDIATGRTQEFAYELTQVGKPGKPKLSDLNEILAVNDHQFLVLERDGKGLGNESKAAFKRLYLIDLASAQDVSDVEGAAALAQKAVKKTLFLDMVSTLTKAGIKASHIPAKLEGASFGQDVTLAGKTRHTLWLSSDNDFLASVPDKDGKMRPNPNRLYVYGFTDQDLPGYQAEMFTK